MQFLDGVLPRARSKPTGANFRCEMRQLSRPLFYPSTNGTGPGSVLEPEPKKAVPGGELAGVKQKFAARFSEPVHRKQHTVTWMLCKERAL